MVGDVGGVVSGSIYGKCGCAKIKNGDKIVEKSEKNIGWLVMLLGVLFQDPGYISIYGKYSYAKMKNGDKIGDGW
jgi:hypothetical protein